MDLFDLGCYFAHLVPVQSLSNLLLRFSACAYAAKQIGRVRGRKATVGGLVSTQAEMELYPHPETVDWAYIGAKYYDRAISLLMEELSNSNPGKQDLPITPMPEDTFSPQGSAQSPQSAPSIQANKRRRLSRRMYFQSTPFPILSESASPKSKSCFKEYIFRVKRVFRNS